MKSNCKSQRGGVLGHSDRINADVRGVQQRLYQVGGVISRGLFGGLHMLGQHARCSGVAYAYRRSMLSGLRSISRWWALKLATFD